MPNDELIFCPTCGGVTSKQKAYCPKHDVVHEQGKHCERCAEEENNVPADTTVLRSDSNIEKRVDTSSTITVRELEYPGIS